MRPETTRLLNVLDERFVCVIDHGPIEAALDEWLDARLRDPKVVDAIAERLATEVPFFDSIGTTYECRIVRKEARPSSGLLERAVGPLPSMDFADAKREISDSVRSGDSCWRCDGWIGTGKGKMRLCRFCDSDNKEARP